MIESVGVVVPVHDEARHLPRCLEALGRALDALPRSLERCAVIVLDACTDDSEPIVRAWCDARERRHVRIAARNVGTARAVGMTHVLEALSATATSCTWLATTDADSTVPCDWLVEQLQHATHGVDAIAGSIRVRDWTEFPAGFAERFLRFYQPEGSDDAHTHVHGANLGVRADAYLAAGGFESLTTGEDHALWRALEHTARRRMSSRRLAVTTSARLQARAPHGFSGFLAAMQEQGSLTG